MKTDMRKFESSLSY